MMYVIVQSIEAVDGRTWAEEMPRHYLPHALLNCRRCSQGPTPGHHPAFCITPRIFTMPRGDIRNAKSRLSVSPAHGRGMLAWSDWHHK
jgi:hypothetical protein